MALLLSTVGCALLMATFASAMDICPTGSISDDINLDYPDTYIAQDCILSNVVVFAAMPPNTTSTFLTFQSCNVSVGYLDIELFDSSFAFEAPPIFITIKDNVFPDTYFYIYGYLPENSSITFQGNMMTRATRLGTFALVSIYLDSLYLTSNSAMYIIDNVINASTQEGYNAFVFNCDRLDLYDNSSLNIIRNTIHVDGWVGGALIYVAQTDVYGINSSFNVMGNSLSATSNLTISAFHVELQRGDKSSVFSLSSNFINISSTDAASTPILIDNPINLNLKLDNNQIHYSSETVFSFYDAYRLSGFSIRGNTIQATKPITANIAQIDIFSIFPNGSYVVANNKVTAPSVTTTDSPLLFVNELRKYVDYYYEMDNSTLVHHCGNSLPWSTDPTSEQLFSSEVLDIVIADADLCGQTSHSKLPSLGVSLGVLISFLAFIILH